MVARPVKPSDIATNPKAKASVDEEWKKLRAIRTWLEDTAHEYDDVRTKTLKEGNEAHFGRVFALCHEKHSEDPKKSKYKGRVVFQGNQVADHTATMAVFQDIGSSACLLTAFKIVALVAAAPGNKGEQSDAPQAYTQAELQGIETWIELPREQWPEAWEKFRRPVCRLRLALYGHPMSGVYWELHCNQRLKKKSFSAIPGWEQCFWHSELKLILIVYVDDFKMAGPEENLAKGWKLISEEIKLDEPTPLTRYLGCDQDFGTINRTEVQKTIDKFAPVVEICRTPKAPSILNTAMVSTRTDSKPNEPKKLASITYKMDGFAAQCVERYLELSNQKESCLKSAPTPTFDETTYAAADFETKGELAGVCAKIVMKILFMALFFIGMICCSQSIHLPLPHEVEHGV